MKLSEKDFWKVYNDIMDAQKAIYDAIDVVNPRRSDELNAAELAIAEALDFFVKNKNKIVN